jgi:hypothetical protein
VSKSAVAIHLEALGLTHEGFYREMLALWRLRQKPRSGGRATHVERQANRLSGRHVRTVNEALKRGVITRLDVFEFTNVKPKYFESLIREVDTRRTMYGRPG